jgi:long-subunit acyl-CoA synthetase (AMP-forming)
VASVRQILSLGPELGEIVSSRPEIASSGQLPPAFPSPTADAMAILPYSSGTTGTPKGTTLSHREPIPIPKPHPHPHL